MIRTLVKNTLLTRSSCTGAAVRFNSFEPNRTRSKEIRDVKIIGTIYQKPLAIESGAKVLTIKTVQPDNHYKVHRAIIKNQKILSMIGDNLSVGHRVYLSGELRSKSFVNNENQNRQRINIYVNELYASKPATSKANTIDADGSESQTDTTKYPDYNSVFLMSHIISEIQHTESFSRFYMSSNLTVRNPVDGDGQKLAFINVFVHDRNLIDYLKENLQKRDKIFVNGFLNYKPEIDQNGEKAFSGFVEATNILRIDRFSDIANQNPIDEKIEFAGE